MLVPARYDGDHVERHARGRRRSGGPSDDWCDAGSATSRFDGEAPFSSRSDPGRPRARPGSDRGRGSRPANGHDSSDTTASYRSKLTGALSPVVAANTSVSNSVQSLQGTNTTAAKNAANQAQSAISSARGAVGALSVPSDSTQLSQQVQQALTQEDGYMQAVTATLSSQNAENIAQLRSAATQTQSALVPLAGVAAGASGSLNGSAALASWANGRINATTAAQKKAQKAAAHKTSHTATTTTTTIAPTTTTTAGPASTSGGSDCGGGLHAGPNTSCPFAANVRMAWENAPIGEAQLATGVTRQSLTRHTR